ncbi:MAG: hypothetical protein ABF247_11305 [Nonlabens sp.]|uniref:hypothetical protein n=2 Tax=Nonlabens sp. TaxID=1888209 RepID=UPI00321AF250
MGTFNNIIRFLFKIFLSAETRDKTEKVILTIAIVSFFLHLAFIFLVQLKVLELPFESDLLENPISAAYTPFSFILIYEVYLLIYYLPKSFTTYITKQYEIITLIIIRKLFKDLSALELSSEWFEIKGDLQFTYDLLGSLLLFYLIFLFQKQGRRKVMDQEKIEKSVKSFISKKKIIATALIPLLFGMALYTFIDWTLSFSFNSSDLNPFESINDLFFDEFFSVLIIVDVVLLLVSLFYTDQFHKIIRNSGFIISTILIRMSFGVSGAISTILIVVAVLFGLSIIFIHNKYEKDLSNIDNDTMP